jgi:hypothetical protein
MINIRVSQGLSNDVLNSWSKSPPPPQNTSAVVGNLKYLSVSVGFVFLSEIRPISPARFWD